MINFLSNWVEGIAIAVIITSIFEMIIPNGNLKKYVKIILGIYIIFSIIAPFVDSKKLYSIDVSKIIDNYSENKNTSNNVTHSQEELEQMYIETFEEEITKTVEKQGYNVYKCTVNGIFDAENKNAGISKIEIILDSKNGKADEDNEGNIKSENMVSIQNIQEVDKIEINIGEKSGIAENNSEISLQDISELKKYLSEHYELDKKIIYIQKR